MNVYDALIEHTVTRLCHFTKFQSLVHILSSPDGILATEYIIDNKYIVDYERKDNQKNFVCCSIEYPNSWFLDNAKSRNTSIFNDWVVLYIKPEIVIQRNVKVSECNAARSNGMFIKNGNYNTTEHLFDNTVPSFKYPRTQNMLKSCPTNAQAEILIEHSIPRDFIFGIAVGDKSMANRVYAALEVLNTCAIDIFVSPQVINKEWRPLIQQGRRPSENRFQFKKEKHD